MKRTVYLGPAALAFAAACSSTSAEPSTGQSVATERASAIRVVRQDRLVLGPETRICVTTTMDPEAKRIVEAAGQRLDPGGAEGITSFTTSRLGLEFMDRGWPSHKPRNRILGHIEHELNPKACFDRPDTILVRHTVARGKSRRGYAVRLTATQGRRTYAVAVERPYAVKVPEEIRAAIDYRSNYEHLSRQPYWDPVRDSAKMSDMFITHLLEVPA